MAKKNICILVDAIARIVSKVRIWGIRGVLDFFVGKVHDARLRAYFLENAEEHPCKTSRNGITILADFYGNHSLNKVMRDLVIRCHETGIPYQTFEIGKQTKFFKDELDGLLTPQKDFQIKRFSHVIDMFNSPLPAELGLDVFHIVFWEFESGILETYPGLASGTPLIGMSDFVVESLRNQLPSNVPVHKMLYPFRILNEADLPPKEIVRSRYGIGQDEFVVFFNFDYGSSVFRKNPEGAIRAFAGAFSNVPKTRLVFKTNHKREHGQEAQRLWNLADSLGISDRFTTIDDFIPIEDVYGLTNACDVYLSLHRGEGFGLGVAEAMSLGKPVVVTDYSATTEFCTEENAIPVPYKIINITKGQLENPCYFGVRASVDPDVVCASRAMSDLHDDPLRCKLLGEKAKKFIVNYYSTAEFLKSLSVFLGKQSKC